MLVRELLTSFGIDFDEKSAQKADTAVDKLKKGAIKLAKTFGALVVGRAIVGFVNNITIAADRVAKTAANIGITTDALQELRYAAELSGVGVEEFDGNMERFIRRLGEAADGTGEATAAYKQLGIKLTDSSGRTRAAEDVFMDASDAIAGMGDQTRQAAISADLFGRSGIRMLGMLRKGAPGIAAMRKELRDLGGIFGVDLLESSEKYRDELTRLNRLFRGFKIILIQVVLPAILAVVGKFIEWGKIISPIIRNSKILQSTLLALGLTVILLGAKIALANIPLILMAVAILALVVVIGLLANEFYVFFTGGETLIGKLAKALNEFLIGWIEQPIDPEAHWFMKALHMALGFLNDLEMAVADVVYVVLKEFGKIESVADFFKTLWNVPIRIWQQTWGRFFAWVAAKLKGIPVLGKLAAGVSAVTGGLAEAAAFEIGVKKAAPLLAPAGGAGFGFGAPVSAAAPMLAPGAVGGSSIVNANRIQIDNNITQQPGQSGEELADMVSSNVEDVIKRHISSATAATTPAVAGGG